MSAFPHNLILRLGYKALGGQSFQSRVADFAPATAEVRTDSRKMRVYGVCTSGVVDRSREIVVPGGVDWSEYERNPIVTTLHQWRDPKGIVGHAVIDGRFSLERRGDQWHYGSQFIQSGPNARYAAEAFGLIETGVLKGVSLGFRFIGANSEQVVASDGHPALKINQSVPFEITHLPVPDNPDAVVLVVEKGLNGRRLSQCWLDLLRPMVPKVKFHGFQTQKREKAMPQPMPDPSAGDPNADPSADPSSAQQQPPTPAQQLPQTKPSIAFLLATEQYLMGFIRFLKSQSGIQDHPLVKNLIPGLILHLSQAYRGLATAHQTIQAEDPAFPNMLGHGGLISPDPAPAGLGGSPVDSAAGVQGQPGFGDGLDDATGLEINSGVSGMGAMDQSAPMSDTGGPEDGQLSDDDVNGLAGDSADTSGDAGAATGDGDSAVGTDQSAGDTGYGPDAGASQGGTDPDDDEDEDTDAPMQKKKKGFAPENSEQRIILIREKGLPIAFERARRLLAAHEQSMKRQFQETDLNVLLWMADNLDALDPTNVAKAKVWCREKAMDGMSRPAAQPKPAERPVMGSPEYQAEVEAEITRLLAERKATAV